MIPAIISLAMDGRTGLYLQFGGQGGRCIDELEKGWNGVPRTKPVIEAITAVLKQELECKEVSSSGLFQHGIDVVWWLREKENRPDWKYLTSSAVSQPLIFMTQVANLLTLEANGIPLQGLADIVKGVTGHSQGIMAAVLFSMCMTGDEFVSAASSMAKWFLWQGIRMQQAFPEYDLPPALIKECVDSGIGGPSPMASVSGLGYDALKDIIIPAGGVSISLKNFYDRFVISGPPESLVRIGPRIRAGGYGFEFLNTSAPFHSSFMKDAMDRLRDDLAALSISFKAEQLKVPVFATDTGKDLRGSKDLMEDLLRMMFVSPVDWPLVLSNVAKDGPRAQLIDLGPGDAAARLSKMNLQGYGINVIPLSTDEGRRQLFSASRTDIVVQRPWTSFGPRRFVEFTGYAPVFGGGMTPTTMEPDMTVAAANEGFIVELAGGGQVTEKIFRERLDKAVACLRPGRGIIVNTLFLDPYLWDLHFDLIPRLKAEGYPLIGVTISAGIPEKEDALKILKRFNDSGIWCNSFKAGTEEQIDKVLDIAASCRGAGQNIIILQVEGGRAGGHHSWNDLEPLVLKKYAKIREQSNIILCVGGGISSKEEVEKWFDGSWHGIDGLPPMPVEGVFVGTVLMTVREAKTSEDVKDLLIATEGAKKWIRKNETAGGITSSESSLGADIYYIDNSAAKAARLLDSGTADKKEIIEALGRTAKPYFGELSEMTYRDVLDRMKELMGPGNIAAHIPHDGDWYDASYRERYDLFERRARERLPDTGKWQTTLLHPEDVDYFIWLCKRPGKPVNFVPVIDDNVRKWFRSDSLWQSHDPRYKADQVFIMPGPISVRAVKKKNVPVVEILRGLCSAVPAFRPDDIARPEDRGYVDGKALYERLWGGTRNTRVSFRLERQDIVKYAAAVGEKARAFVHGVDGKLYAPLNMTFVIAWGQVTSVIWDALKGNDLSRLVHLGNSLESKGGGLFKEGETLQCSARLDSIVSGERGITVVVSGEISSESGTGVSIESSFFIRGPRKIDRVHNPAPRGTERVVSLRQPRDVFSASITAPHDTSIYAGASMDHNPIHLDDSFAKMAGFKERIVHGMWTSAAMMAAVTREISTADPSNIFRWDITFESPVYPGTAIDISCTHVARSGGADIYDVIAMDRGGNVVAKAKARHREKRSAYMFTGQGSQEKMMGMDGYARSPAARAVWDEADGFCRDELGFSILKVVRDNPREMFVGRTRVHHPNGVINLTQFTQVALTVFAMAAVAELKETGAYVDDAAFCGHSLGEYAALSCSGIIPLRQVIRTVYHRGLTMQNFVPRDGNGRSPYGMCVVRPNIVKMSHEELEGLIRDISSKGGGLLEVVNYNIEGEQYSVTGETRLLKILEKELKDREKKVRAAKTSIIFLEGIDVPFHSTVLRPGVDAFRKTLEETIPERIDPGLLAKRYIPNLNARPFELSKEYIKEVHSLTGSPVLLGLISSGELMPEHSRILLIELLAYQFASPVQWIATQEHLLRMGRLVEIGPKPVLTGMLRRTVSRKGMAGEGPSVHHVNELF